MNKIAVRINPFFWLMALFIGWLNAKNFSEIIVWVFVVFISVLVHEMGHALTALFFKQKVQIQLTAFGGLTIREGKKLNPGKEFLVVLAGPLFGLMLFIIAAFCMRYLKEDSSLLFYLLKVVSLVNLLWSLLNLIPVMPLDGGQLLKIVMEKIFGFQGVKGVHFVSLILASLLTILALVVGQFFIAILFIILAYTSYKGIKQSQVMKIEDTDNQLQEAFESAEKKMLMGQKEEALLDFKKIRTQVKEGLIYTIATETQALLQLEKNDMSMAEREEIYHMLMSLPKISNELIATFHKLSFEVGDFVKTVELSEEAYQLNPLPQTALINAMALAQLHQAGPSLGWLENVISDVEVDIDEIILKKEFDPIRETEEFKQFIS